MHQLTVDAIDSLVSEFLLVLPHTQGILPYYGKAFWQNHRLIAVLLSVRDVTNTHTFTHPHTITLLTHMQVLWQVITKGTVDDVRRSVWFC